MMNQPFQINADEVLARYMTEEKEEQVKTLVQVDLSGIVRHTVLSES